MKFFRAETPINRDFAKLNKLRPYDPILVGQALQPVQDRQECLSYLLLKSQVETTCDTVNVFTRRREGWSHTFFVGISHAKLYLLYSRGGKLCEEN